MFSSKLKSISWLNALSVLLVLASLMMLFTVPSFAEEGDEEDDDTPCLVNVALPMIELYTDMTTFLGDHYNNEAPASELLDTTQAKFEEFEENMIGLLQEYAVYKEGGDIQVEAENVQICTEAVYLKIKELEKVMENHHMENAGRKTTYTLVTKLKDINDGLADMAKDFGQIYALWSALSNKLTSTTGN